MPAPRKPKCARCGHPEGKHAKGARGGCSVRVMKWATYDGKREQRLTPCNCPAYQESENT